ncbi:hypothetical protein R1flu_016359 [Riccia fluitans]|uniref:3-hydroxyacyl-CoA dehydrogenase n=1 Tax=Riccia fluitans TaxID=41844 RepID=A0ABD1YM73_9MARC
MGDFMPVKGSDCPERAVAVNLSVGDASSANSTRTATADQPPSVSNPKVGRSSRTCQFGEYFLGGSACRKTLSRKKKVKVNMARPIVTMDVGDDGVAIITMKNPPVNAISGEMISAVFAKFKAAHSRKDVKAIVLTGADGKFCGGADIRGMQVMKSVGTAWESGVVTMNEIIEDGPKPAVAAIETFALGGGLELAMACHARLATPNTRLGLPELQLGIIPGLGGTQRLPRLVGVAKAIDMMLTVQMAPAKDALKSGLVDAVVPPERLIAEARKWALNIASGQIPWHRSLARSDHLGSVEESLKIIKEKRVEYKHLFKNVPHPGACLDVVEHGLIKDPYAATILEERMSVELQVSPTGKALMHVFFSERAVLKVPGVTDTGLKPRQIRSVAIVGGGLMGSGIATAVALQQIPVLIKETDTDALKRALNTVKVNLENRAKKGALTQQKLQSAISLVRGTLDYKDFGNVDLVVEAAFESIPLKQQIFEDLERYCKPDCILATNTSLIDIDLVGAKTRCQERLAGTHFFSPAHIMPLLELVRTEKTSPQVQLDLINFAKVIRKVPLTVNSSIGFAVNRAFFSYGSSANFLAIQLGVDPYRIDRILKNFGMPVGPFRLADMTGQQISLATNKLLRETFPHRTLKMSLSDLMVEKNRLGEKTGKGVYNYKPGTRKEEPAPELSDLLAEARKRAGLGADWREVSISDEEVLEMVLFPVVNEACRVLEEKVVLRSSDLDLASILGMGFPKYRGGIIFWGDSIGAGHIHSQLSKWFNLYKSNGIGDFYKPSPSLERSASSKRKLASIVEVSQSRL